MELNTLPEETNVPEHWLQKESKYVNTSKLALHLILVPSSEALCGVSFWFAVIYLPVNIIVLTHAKVGLEIRVLLKLNNKELVKYTVDSQNGFC